MKVSHIKSQDILVLLKLLAAEPGREFNIAELAYELGVSASEVSMGLRRLREARLVAADRKSPLRANALEFLIHGLKYMIPGKLDSIKRGIPTAHAAPPLSRTLKSSPNDLYVWASDDGMARGQSMSPLHPSVPKAALRDQKLYELLALVDAIRIGRAREQGLARSELSIRILGAGNFDSSERID